MVLVISVLCPDTETPGEEKSFPLDACSQSIPHQM